MRGARSICIGNQRCEHVLREVTRVSRDPVSVVSLKSMAICSPPSNDGPAAARKFHGGRSCCCRCAFVLLSALFVVPPDI